MLGAAHAAANPLTARFGVVHGTAVGLMLPHVVRFNSHLPEIREIYESLIPSAGSAPGETLARHLEALLDTADMPGSIAECGVRGEAIPQLAEEAASQWTAQFNPRSLSVDDFDALYRAAFATRDRQ